MNWTDIQNQLVVLHDEFVIDSTVLYELDHEALWNEIASTYPGELTDTEVENVIKLMAADHTKGQPWTKRLKAIFHGLGKKVQQRQQQLPTDDGRCSICTNGSPMARERHIKQLAIQKYTHYIWETPVEIRDLDWALELVYNHARTHYGRNPEIRQWAIDACKQIEPF